MRISNLSSDVCASDLVGACTAIDRGTVSATRIGNNTKIDDLVMIGHNCIIGENCMLCGQVGIAGSCTVGDRVVLAGQVGIADHITIGSDVVVGGGRSDEHTSELQSLMRISYDVFCLKKKHNKT